MQASFAGDARMRSRGANDRQAAPDPAALPEPSAVEAVLHTPRRVHPIPAWRLRLVALTTQLVLLLAVGTWMMSTDEVGALASKILRVHPLTRVSTDRPDVGVIVRAQPQDVLLLAAELAVRGIHVSFADDGRVLSRVAASPSCARWATSCCQRSPTPARCCAGCARAGTLHAQARALGLGHRFYCLQPLRRADRGSDGAGAHRRRDPGQPARCD